MEKKHVIGIAIVVLAAIGFFAYPQVRWLQFRMDAGKVLRDDFGRFPSPEQIIKIDDKLTALATKRGFPTPTYTKVMTAQAMAGGVIFYILTINVKSDGKEASLSHRVETGGIQNEFAVLQEAGITIRGTE